MNKEPEVHAIESLQSEDRIPVWFPIVNMLIIIAASILFNFFPEKIGYIKSPYEPSSFVPLLSPEFQGYLPWLDLYWGLAFSLQVVHLINRRWTTGTRWGDLSLSIFGVILMGWIVVGVPVSNTLIASMIVRFTLVVVLIITVIETIKKVSMLLDGKRVVVRLEKS